MTFQPVMEVVCNKKRSYDMIEYSVNFVEMAQ
jgi:hypothetical protein